MQRPTVDSPSLAACTEKLEKQNKLYKGIGLVLLLSVAIVTVAEQARPISAVQGQTQPPQKDEAMLTFRGGLGSSLLRQCQTAVKLGIGVGGSHNFKAGEMQDVVDGEFCSGYILGIVDTFNIVRTPDIAADAERICIPNNVDGDQLDRVVAKYLDDNPAVLNNPADLLVVRSMVDAFPCK